LVSTMRKGPVHGPGAVYRAPRLHQQPSSRWCAVTIENLGLPSPARLVFRTTRFLQPTFEVSVRHDLKFTSWHFFYILKIIINPGFPPFFFSFRIDPFCSGKFRSNVSPAFAFAFAQMGCSQGGRGCSPCSKFGQPPAPSRLRVSKR